MYVSVDTIRTLDDALKVDFQAARDIYFGWLLIASGAVAIGVILEGPEVIHESARVVKKLAFGKDLPDNKTPSWITLVALLGWILVALGVAGEGIAEVFVSKADSQIEGFNNALLVGTQAEITDANVRAALATERAANAGKEAALANERTARILAEVAWRNLDAKLLAIPLKAFSGTKFGTAVYGDNPEENDFRFLITTALEKAAGWIESGGGFSMYHRNLGSITGIVIGVEDKPSDKTIRAAAALIKALNEQHIIASPRSASLKDVVFCGPVRDMVCIGIGRKPMLTSTQKK